MGRFEVITESDGTFTLMDDGIVYDRGFKSRAGAIGAIRRILAEVQDAEKRAAEALSEASAERMEIEMEYRRLIGT